MGGNQDSYCTVKCGMSWSQVDKVTCCEESGSIEWIAGHQMVIWMAGMKNDMLRSGVKEDVYFWKASRQL